MLKTLTSGATLDITIAPFSEAKALYMAVFEEATALKLDPKAEVDANFYKDIFCTALSSRKIEAALNVCMRRVIYNGKRISDETWEDVSAREDYFEVCFEVARENVQPFMKSLYAKYSDIFQSLKGIAPA